MGSVLLWGKKRGIDVLYRCLKLQKWMLEAKQKKKIYVAKKHTKITCWKQLLFRFILFAKEKKIKICYTSLYINMILDYITADYQVLEIWRKLGGLGTHLKTIYLPSYHGPCTRRPVPDVWLHSNVQSVAPNLDEKVSWRD